jgi:hypothetical protein
MNDDLFADELVLFGEFAEAESQLAESQRAHHEQKRAVAMHRNTSRIETRRAKTEAHLRDLLPTDFTPGTSWHVISHGDVDAMSYLIHIVATRLLTRVIISTWCMAMPDIQWIESAICAGRIGRVEFFLGEIFPSQYGDEYLKLCELEREDLIAFRISRNHSKIMICESDGEPIVIESSANVNTNPRIEQTAIHCSAELAAFYADFFQGIRDIDGKRHERATS